MILCSHEEYDSILGCPSPNGTSKTWYIKELGQLRLPFTFGPWNILQENGKMFSKKTLQDQSRESSIPSLFYAPIGKLKNKSHLYIIKVWNPLFFELNKNIGFDVIDKRVIADVRKNRSKIIIINTFEGYSGSSGNYDFEILQEWCCKYDFNNQQVYYFNGNLLTEKLLENKNYNFTGLGLSVFENWIRHDFECTPTFNESDFKLFLSYNRRNRDHRIELVSKLFLNNLLNVGKISFHFQNEENPLPEVITDTQWAQLNSKLPLILDKRSINHNPASSINLKDFNNTFVSLVTETLADDNTLFISEKTWKPISVAHPFIILGNKGTLQYLRSRGFKTFEKWWDESYDLQDSFSQRCDSVIKILNNLTMLSNEELKYLYAEIKPTLEHNRKLFKNIQIQEFNINGNSYSKELESYLKELFLTLPQDY